MIKLLLGLVCLLYFTSGIAQKNTNEISEKFFTLYSKDPILAMDYIASTNKWSEKMSDEIRDMKNKLKTLLDRIGDYKGHELISERSTGQSVKIASYILKYDREPIRLILFFYKTSDTWRVQTYSFDESVGEELKDAVKSYSVSENDN